MALRKKGLKVAVTAMAIISVITSGGLNNIYADGSIDKNITVIERTLEDKVYSVANKIEYVKDGEIITSGHGYQSLRDALSENTLNIPKSFFASHISNQSLIILSLLSISQNLPC